MRSTPKIVLAAVAIVPMVLAAGVVSTAADEGTAPSRSAVDVAATETVDLGAMRALADLAEAAALGTAGPADAPSVDVPETVAVPETSTPPSTPASEQAAPERVYREYVSLGDSWSAATKLLDLNGLPDDTHAPIDCAQSQTNYPKLLAAELGVEIHRDATCGSATSDDFWEPQSGLPLGGTNPAQFDRLTPTTDLVTIGIGGNDAGVAGAALSCLSVLPDELAAVGALVPPLPDLGLPLVPGRLPLGGCKEHFTAGGVDVLDEAIKASEPKLVRAIQEVRERSPEARILMVDYLAALPQEGCFPLLPMTTEDLDYIRQSFDSLNAMVRRAAETGGAEFVDTYTPSIGHDVCAAPTERYVEVVGLSVNDLGIVIPAHPNAAGARAQFRAVLEQVRKG